HRPIVPSLDARSHDDDRVEVALAAYEAARHVGVLAAADDGVEALARRVRNRDQDDVRLRLVQHAPDLVETAQDRDALQPPAPQARLVVDEAEHLPAGRRPHLAQEAAAAAPGAA